MEEIQNNPTNLCEEVLEHHGILGMKWGVRRYQPYPDNYAGDGKFVGKKTARAERRQARHVAKTNTRIKNAVDTGNKKKLKKYKDEMSPEEYEKKYAETVKNGIDNAIKDRDKSALKKYKGDLNKREYQHQKDRIEFKEAIDNDNSRKTKKLLSKVDPEDVTEATNLIRSRVALQDQKLSKIRQDSELMAKMDKLASGLGKVSKISQNVSNITSSFMSVNKSMTEFANAQKDADKKRKEKELEKVIRSGDLKKIRENEKKMTQAQLNEAYDRIVQSGSEEDIKKAAPYMNNKQITAAVQKLNQMDKLNGRAGSSDPETTTTSEASRSAPIQAVRDWIDSGFAAGSTPERDDPRRLSYATTVGQARSIFGASTDTQNLWWNSPRDGSYTILHSDDISYEDVLAHHGVLGMHWGIRRYQPYPKGYKGDGKEIGQAKRVGLGDRKYQSYDVSFAKQGSAVRKKTKYTNIDGSLNEKGKLHAQKYISKQIDKNEKYYAKEIAKYEKKAEKYKDSNPELSKKFKDMAKDAARSRDGVNKSIKGMAIDEIMTNEAIENAKLIKGVKTAVGVTVGAATGGAVLAGGLGLSSALSTSENFAKAKQQAYWELENAKAQFKLSEPVDSLMRISNTSEIGRKAEQVIEDTIRTYSDARAYVLGIGLDQAVNRMGWLNAQYGTTDKIAKIAGDTGKSALDTMGFTPQTISDLNDLVTNTGNVVDSVINNPNTIKLINASGSNVNSVINNPNTIKLINASGSNVNSVINNPNTIKLINASGSNVNSVLSNPAITANINEFNKTFANNVPAVTQQTLGTKSALDQFVADSIPRQGDITKKLMNSSVPVSQQRKMR